MRKDDVAYLAHIRDAIERIESYTEGMDATAFKENLLVQDGVIRQLEIIGEATKQLSSSSTQRQPGVPWHDIAAMRDKLIHRYFGVNVNAIWLTVKRDLPALKKAVTALGWADLTSRLISPRASFEPLVN